MLRELPERVAAWMERLQGEGVRGADLVFACIGPALEIFSRCRAVETAGRPRGRPCPNISKRSGKSWAAPLLEQVLGAAGGARRSGRALEEDARLTALFLWTLQSTEAPDGNGGEEEDEETAARATAGGFNLPFDVVRRFSQPMGIDLERWTGRVIGQDKAWCACFRWPSGPGRCSGEDGARAAAEWIEDDANADPRPTLFPDTGCRAEPARRGRGNGTVLDDGAALRPLDATVLDRVHAAMLLQAGGHANALRALIASEQDRGPDFPRLANALSALYPRGSREKRLLDAMLLAAPR